MEFINNTFNTREQAFFLWGLVFIVWLLFNKKVRLSITTFFKAFSQNKIPIVFLIMIVYVCLQAFLLYEIKLWDFSLIKDTIYWFLVVAFLLFVNVTKVNKEENYFKKLITDNIKIVVVIEFIVNLYTFNIIIEIIFVPIFITSILISIYSEYFMSIFPKQREKYLQVNKIFNFIVGVFVIIVIIYSIYNVFSDFKSFCTLENLKAFILPFLLLISFIPFLYFLALFISYDSFIKNIDLFLKQDEVMKKFIKKKVSASCNINLRKLNKFIKETYPKIIRINNKEEIYKIINSL